MMAISMNRMVISIHSSQYTLGWANEACSPACDDWAIWSHSWYAFSNRSGPDGQGPAFNPDGGVQIGDSDYWVGKYTIQPENGGVGVFTHEYGHDLGLPDLYDTAGGENGTGFWTLMSSGSWVDTGQDTIGNAPSHMGAWEKFQLGWLNYEVALCRSEIRAQAWTDGNKHQASPRIICGTYQIRLFSRISERPDMGTIITTVVREITWTT